MLIHPLQRPSTLVRPSHGDLGLIGAASGKTRELARLAVRSLMQGHELDVQLACEGWNYDVTLIEVNAESIIGETTLHISWNDITEPIRLGLLELWVRQILLAAERSKRRSDAALRTVMTSLPSVDAWR